MDKHEYEYEHILDVEDHLQEAGIFYNGLRGEEATCHMDSYMTCVNFNKCLELMESNPFPVEQIIHCIKYWQSNVNCQPPIKIVSALWKTHLQKENHWTDN